MPVSHRARIARLIAAVFLAMAWFVPSYLLVGSFTLALGNESWLYAGLFFAAWFTASTLLFVLLGRVVRGAPRSPRPSKPNRRP